MPVQDVFNLTRKTEWHRPMANNSTKGSLSAFGDNLTGFDTVDSGTPTGNYIAVPTLDRTVVVAPFGTDAADEAFNMAIWGVSRMLVDRDRNVYQWHPVLLYQGLVTLGATTGVAGGLVDNTNFFADTITRVTGVPTGADLLISSPGGDSQAEKNGFVEVRNRGFQRIIVDFDLTTAASANALVRWY